MTSAVPHVPHGPAPLHPDDLVTPAELSAVLGWALPDMLGLLVGPFALDDDGRLPVRLALGAIVYAQLGLRHILPPELAARIAGAATNADPCQARSLVVAWRAGLPLLAWFGGDPPAPPVDPTEVFGSPMRGPTVCLPADFMLHDLCRVLSMLRERDAVAPPRMTFKGSPPCRFVN